MTVQHKANVASTPISNVTEKLILAETSDQLALDRQIAHKTIAYV